MALIAHSRLVMSGTIGTTQTWSTGIGLDTSPVIDPNQQALATFLDAARAPIETFIGFVMSSLNGADTKALKAVLSYYPAGSTRSNAIAELVLSPGLIGQQTQQSNPTYVSCVASLRTGTPGRSGRGRMYLPATAYSITNHQFLKGLTDTLATNLATFLVDLAAVAPEGYTPAVCGKNGNYLINEVVIDSLPDVQHRREDKIGAASVSVAAL